MALLATHWLDTLDRYSAMPLPRKASISSSGTFHCALSLLPIRLSSIKGLSSAGSTGSSEAATTIATTDSATTLR